MNDVERLKKEKGGLEVLEDLKRYTSEGYAAITEDDFFRLRWYGLYQQKPRDSGFFMLRVKIPGGELTSVQARVIGEVTEKYCRGINDITTRQNFQFHWLAVEDVIEVFERFAAVGLTTVGACGDIPRNVTSCPAEGISKDSLFDARPYVMAVHEFFLNNPEFADMPRKYKLSVSGCSKNCAQPEINDIAATPAVKDGAPGFHVRVGGGLSSRPFFAKRMDMWVPADKLVDVFRAATEVYRDRGNRDNRKKARIKFLIDEWGIEKFEAEVRARLDWKPEKALDTEDPFRSFDDHIGIREQNTPGLFTVGAIVLTGRMGGKQLIECARLAEEFGDGTLRTTNQQNLLFPGVPEDRVQALVAGLKAIGLPVKATSLRQAAVACTGSEFCNLALTETKALLKEVVDYLDERVDVGESIRLSLNGCPNSCGQHWIGDIGLQGCVVKQPGGPPLEGYDIFLGGRLGRDAKFVRPISRRVPATQVKVAIENLLKGYLDTKEAEEDFSAFVDRTPDEALASLMAVTVAAS